MVAKLYNGFWHTTRRRIVVSGDGPCYLLDGAPFGVEATDWSWDWGSLPGGLRATAWAILRDWGIADPAADLVEAFALEVLGCLPDDDWELWGSDIQTWVCARAARLAQGDRPARSAEGGGQ